MPLIPFAPQPHASPSCPRHRLRICLAAFLLLLLVVWGRAAQLEVSSGEAFRAQAAAPLVRRRSVPGVRGRILARDGTLLACDRRVSALAVQYRYLEEPCNRAWLRLMARSRIKPQERRDWARVSAEETRVLAERRELVERLAGLCAVSMEQWTRRARQIQSRVERIAASVNRHLQQEKTAPLPDPAEPPDATPAESLRRRVLAALRSTMQERPGRMVVAEELDYHIMVDEVSLAVIAEVEGNPRRYPGVKIVQRWRRDYPGGTLAAHVLGHLGPGDTPAPDDAPALVGRTGLERQYEQFLAGHCGMEVELTDHGGRILNCYRQREPVVGRDLLLTLDARLQQAAETLLDQAVARREAGPAGGPSAAEPGGGAIVVLDVQNGAVLAAASAPRFDPRGFARGVADVNAVLHDPARPLFDRATAMAIAPGSVFKIVTAVALLESGGVDPQAPHLCRGYLDTPDRWRCAVYRRRREGHGEVALRDAMAQSCNVYFFHHARQVGPEPLVAWAQRLGFGRPTGVDLPDEASGTLPTPDNIEKLEKHPWRTADTLELAVGQGSLTVTPLQVARLMAVVANGGRLVTPHLVTGLGLTGTAAHDDAASDPIRVPAPQPVPGLSRATLAHLAEALEAVVADPHGTAHATVYQQRIPIAGKTGTAQVGAGRLEHAWLAGYAPADRPRVAFVVVLEQSGNADTSVGPVVKRLVEQIEDIEPGSRH
jgi:penicillin-binding protein 2